MFSLYGIDRVIEPANVLPTSAWRLDNSRTLRKSEIRIAVDRIQIETTSFKQMSIESNNNADRIKERIADIVIKRGKLHNPVTDTGGVLFGRVMEIGQDYQNKANLQIGDEVIVNTSLASIPLYLSKITKIDFSFGQIEAVGYAIAFNECPIVKRPVGLSIELLLFAFNESATMYSVGKSAQGKHDFLVVGNNMLTNLFFGYAIRRNTGEQARIVCLFDKSTVPVQASSSLDELLRQIFSEIHYGSILKPVDCLERFSLAESFDLSVNCADIPGAETINILATRTGGVVYFANLINNYNIALYITEAVAREVEIQGAVGYREGYEHFDIDMIRQLTPYFGKMSLEKATTDDNAPYQVRKTRHLYESGSRKTMLEDFICESRAMSMVVDEILSVAKYDCNVLITGDTGVGKEKVASIIQKNSVRKMQPFVKINCASISDHLMESEFFGYEKGSFTGASNTGKKGYFELADNGIIFLDEVGELPLEMQAKLLRVIQDGEFYRVGGTAPIKTNVRIISATNRSLEEQMEAKQFRRDLYYRLNVFPIRVPSLQERKEEIPSLVSYFVEQYNEKFGMNLVVEPEAQNFLMECQWPGNIRELENVVQRLMITAKGESITLMDVAHELNPRLFGKTVSLPGSENFEESELLLLDELVGNFEKQVILYASEKYGSSRKAAKALGISQTQFVRKRNKYDNK